MSRISHLNNAQLQTVIKRYRQNLSNSLDLLQYMVDTGTDAKHIVTLCKSIVHYHEWIGIYVHELQVMESREI